ncbi:MAG: hypothetical protein ABID38_00860 [Candidatus Diapherotrites archaeon]
MDKKLILIVGAAVLMTLVVVVVVSVVLISILPPINPDPPSRLSGAKISCINTYGGDENNCKADPSDLGDFAPAGASYAMGCCWYVKNQVCSAKEYPNGIPSQLENC